MHIHVHKDYLKLYIQDHRTFSEKDLSTQYGQISRKWGPVLQGNCEPHIPSVLYSCCRFIFPFVSYIGNSPNNLSCCQGVREYQETDLLPVGYDSGYYDNPGVGPSVLGKNS